MFCIEESLHTAHCCPETFDGTVLAEEDKASFVVPISDKGYLLIAHLDAPNGFIKTHQGFKDHQSKTLSNHWSAFFSPLII